MSDDIRAINASVNRIDNITTTNVAAKDRANIKEEQDKLAKLMCDLSGKTSDDFLINQNLICSTDIINKTPKKSFIKNIFDKFTGKNHVNNISPEDLEAIIDIEQMACLPG